MQLLMVVLHREELLDEVLSTLVEMECPDSVVLESRSGLELLERDLPIFAGLRFLVPSGIDFSRLLLCVIGDDSTASQALAAIADLAGTEAADREPSNTALLVPITALSRF